MELWFEEKMKLWWSRIHCLSVSLAFAAGGNALADEKSASGTESGAATLRQIDVIASPSSLEERESEIASKFILGRNEIQEYGDSNIIDLLKRIPGVAISGTNPGGVSFRGMGNGYTQILVDGHSPSAALPISSIFPFQIERIEVYRSATAETGSQAVAGTINIVLRKIESKDSDRVSAGASFSGHQNQQYFNAIHNRSDGVWSNNTTLSAARTRSNIATQARTDSSGFGAGYPDTVAENSSSDAGKKTITLISRWIRQITPRTTAFLTPTFTASEGETVGLQHRTLVQALAQQLSEGAGRTDLDGRMHAAKLNFGATHQWGNSKIEINGGFGKAAQDTRFTNQRFDSFFGDQDYLNASRRSDSELTLNMKYLHAEDDSNLTGGLEFQKNSRLQHQDASIGFNGEVQGSTTKLAGYLQGEQTISRAVAIQAGLRLEELELRSTQGGIFQSLRYSMPAPSLHLKITPGDKEQGQIRIGIARTYKSPQLAQLFSPYTANPLNPGGSDASKNTPLAYDSAGNPLLKPERATGLDIGYERRSGASGYLSANLFVRRIENYIRPLIQLESGLIPGESNWVSRYYNAGNARTAGIEFESRFSTKDIFESFPDIKTRAALSLYKSRIEGASYRNARIDRQPDFLLQVSGAYKLPKLPITTGMSFNLTPSVTVQSSVDRLSYQSKSLTSEIFANWVLNPKDSLHISLSGMFLRSTKSRDVFFTSSMHQLQTTTTPSFATLTVKFEHEFQ